MKLSIIIFLSLVQSAQALQLTKIGNSFNLSAKTCTEVNELKADLSKWILATNKVTDCNLSQGATSENNSQCSVDVTNCLPEHIKKYHGTYSRQDGPNCWNLALVMKNILPGLRYSSNDEMAFYMGDPLCRALEDSEARLPGDVGAIRSSNKGKIEELHGFIYISEKIAYSKNGYSKFSPYALQTLDEVYSTYNVDKNKLCKKNTIDTNGSCRVAVSYFRCQSLNEYLKTNINIPEELLKTVSDISYFEKCELEKANLEGATLSQISKSNLMDSVKALTTFLEAEKANKNKLSLSDPKQDFLLGSLQLRLNAIVTQLTLSNQKYASYDLKNLQDAFTKSIQDLKSEKNK